MTSFMRTSVIVSLLLSAAVSIDNNQDLTDADRQLILDTHNGYRSGLASGVAPGKDGVNLAVATNMNAFVWDPCLESVATTYIQNNCPNAHNGNRVAQAQACPAGTRGFASPSAVGENLAYGGLIGTPTAGTLTGSIRMWWEERILYTYGYSSPQVPHTCAGGLANCGHFQQMAWSDTVYVGCGLGFCESTTGGNNNYAFICAYYAAGNWNNYIDDPYLTGATASDSATACPAGKVKACDLCRPSNADTTAAECFDNTGGSLGSGRNMCDGSMSCPAIPVMTTAPPTPPTTTGPPSPPGALCPASADCKKRIKLTHVHTTSDVMAEYTHTPSWATFMMDFFDTNLGMAANCPGYNDPGTYGYGMSFSADFTVLTYTWDFFCNLPTDANKAAMDAIFDQSTWTANVVGPYQIAFNAVYPTSAVPDIMLTLDSYENQNALPIMVAPQPHPQPQPQQPAGDEYKFTVNLSASQATVEMLGLAIAVFIASVVLATAAVVKCCPCVVNGQRPSVHYYPDDKQYENVNLRASSTESQTDV